MRKQRGMTFIGLVLTVAAIIFVAVIGMKMAPAYIEFMSVKKAIKKIGNDPGFREMSRKEIYDSFNRTATIDNIRSVKSTELLISKSEISGNVVSVDYEVLIPLMGNVSVLLDFSASTDDAL
ncbi:hypothetical protein MTYP_02389 [Methylophilaceae bacterium]|nr:hypothetical protein MTYP_02389 [Methylophilaceae bacterium]